MQLGAINPASKSIGEVSAGDFDFSALEKKVEQTQKMQIYTLIALAIIIFLLLRNGKN